MKGLFKKSREPRHTRTDKSCTHCAKSKTKCVRIPASTQCKKCVTRGLDCQWPEGEVSRRACDECKKAKVRCEPPRVPNGACRQCEKHNRPCSRAVPQPAPLPPSNHMEEQVLAGPSTFIPTPPLEQAPPPPNANPPPAAPSSSSSPRPTLHIDPYAEPPTTPPSVTSSPRSYWSTVLSSEDDMEY